MIPIITNEMAYEAGGFRERYAMNHYATGNGTKEIKVLNGHRLWIFHYSKADPYQDANGATFDCKERKWIG